MGEKIDWCEYYSEVYGHDKIRYGQGDSYFDSTGNFVCKKDGSPVPAESAESAEYKSANTEEAEAVVNTALSEPAPLTEDEIEALWDVPAQKVKETARDHGCSYNTKPVAIRALRDKYLG